MAAQRKFTQKGVAAQCKFISKGVAAQCKFTPKGVAAQCKFTPKGVAAQCKFTPKEVAALCKFTPKGVAAGESSHQKGWQRSCHLFWCELTLIFTAFYLQHIMLGLLKCRSAFLIRIFPHFLNGLYQIKIL